MKPCLRQRLIDARLIGAERAAPLQQQRDAVEGEPRAQVPALALARCARFEGERSFRQRRVGCDLIAQGYRRHALLLFSDNDFVRGLETRMAFADGAIRQILRQASRPVRDLLKQRPFEP